jgi:23S rRNA pseudouridine2605 synthase
MKTDKLQKILANAGLGSRRTMEQWIADGRVTVNGQLATVGDRVSPQDTIKTDGRVLQRAAIECQVIVYNKPLDEVCTRSDPEGRRTVFASLPALPEGRWVSIGRLDVNTTGLLLFTNDGVLANALMHPSSQSEREYLVRVLGEVDGLMLERLKNGVMLEDGKARFSEVRWRGGRGATQWYHVVIKEGRKREVRRLWESQGVTVSRLKRIRFGSIRLPERMPLGATLELTPRELSKLQSMVRR